MNYVAWALTGMVGYSFVTLFVKLATRSGRFSGFFVLAIATVMVAIIAVCMAIGRGDMRALRDFTGREMWYVLAAGIALTVAVASLFQALSLGPASIVVPVYGMFIVGGALLGILILGEPVTIRKLTGIGLAAVSIYLIAGSRA
jgi:transporter family protein